VNYGHRLEFGAFLTPDASTPAVAVEHARLAEELGYDLVTIQDHPYLPTHLDALTLLSWIAGVTDRVRLAANVHSLPLRDPAILARQTASLDLLTGGRIELGLGAGAYWDAIEAMGGRRLSPGQAVDALSEAIDVVQALLDTGRPGPVRYAGEHYRLAGAQAGPATPHEIPIWVGALKPRMLALVGERADGWSITLRHPGVLAEGNPIIDDAAHAAGRDPREIRRLVNITPDQATVETLVPLVVEHGAGTFILMTDDPVELRRFAHDVMPALREAVDRATPHGSAGIRIRKASSLAKRRPDIDYDAVPPEIDAVEPGDAAYPRVRSTYMRGGAPGLVLRATSTRQVVDALAYARSQGVELSIRSGGHGVSGRSTNDGGIILDVGLMNDIDVLDEATRRVRIGPGARWMDVALALAPHGWALSSGDYGGVGVGGLATAGGVGFLGRAHGLTIDHLRAVEMVLADGSVVRASDAENPDLFWAVRGAGANFGIVTSFEFEADEVGLVGYAQLVQDASDPAGFLHEWGRVVESSPRDLTSFLILPPPRRGQPMIVMTMSVVNADDPDTVIARLQPVADIAPLYQQEVRLQPYAAVMANASDADHAGQGEPISRSGLLEHITPEFAAAAERLIRSGAVHWFQIRSVGGAVNDVDPDATAYAHRSANFSVVAMGSRRAAVDAAWDELLPHFDGLYLSFDSDPRPERILDAFPPRTLARLRDLKAKYDPDNVFRDNFSVTPARSAP
jgi:alkanesulfonate monooxygenase SsuD/methylene tetrahydromethanopterin reductase-like flavin-dependent oxidoreductase (luciferase family)